MSDSEFDNYQELADYSLDEATELELLERQKECVFIWTNKAGEPVGVVMTFLAARGKLWLLCTEKRVRIAAVRRDPRSCVVITSAGLDWGTGKTVTYKGTTRILPNDEPGVSEWLYDEYVAKLNGENNAERISFFADVLNIPERVIMEFTPTWQVSYDGDKMAALTPGASGKFDDMYK